MPGDSIKFELIVGLGNPDSEYEQTRHNAGFWFVDQLASMLGATFSPDKKSHSMLAKATVEGRAVYLLKPYNYMNNSGQGYAAISRFYKIEPEKILVAHDELDLPPGLVKIKKGGGHGGHNGLRDIFAKTGQRDFWRLRIGIGHPGNKNAVSGYVLKRASSDDQSLIDEALDVSLREAKTIIDGDINVATKALHSHKPKISNG